MDETPDTPRDPDAPPPVTAMDRVQDRDDYLETRYDRDYNREYVRKHGDHSGFQGDEETDAEFVAKNPDAPDPEVRRSTYEVLGDDEPEALPDEIPDETSIGHVFLDPDADPDDAPLP